MLGDTVFTFFTIPLFIVLLIVVTIFILFYSLKARDDAQSGLLEVKQNIRNCRLKRYENILQVIKAFGDGNPNTASLTKLADIYTRVKTEQDELKWEEKYIAVMHAFMDYTAAHIPPQLAGGYDMANNAIIANEQALERYREELFVLESKIDSYQKQPMKTFISMGTSLSNFIVRSNDAIEDYKYNAEMAAIQREEEENNLRTLLEEARLADEQRRLERLAQRREEKDNVQTK